MGEVVRIDPLARRLPSGAISLPGNLTVRQRIDLLFDTDDPKAAIRSLSRVQIYGLVLEAGLNDAADMLMLASSEQIQSVVDLDCWRDDRLDHTRVNALLSVLLMADDDVFDEWRLGVDTEFFGLLIRHNIKIYFIHDESDAEEIENIDAHLEPTPDGVFMLVMPDDADTSALIRMTLVKLYRCDQDWTREVLLAARHELTSTLEHEAYRVRNGRIEELGFLPVEEAVEVFSFVKPAREQRAADKVLGSEPLRFRPIADPIGFIPSLAEALLSVTDDRQASFFGRALRLATDDASSDLIDNLLQQVAALTNRVQVANRRDPGDIGQQLDTFRQTHGYLNIGLEYLSRGDLGRAAELLGHWPLKRMLQAGFSLTLTVARMATQLTGRENLSLVEELPYSLCSEGESDLLAGLHEMRPVRSVSDNRYFETLGDLDEVGGVLTTLAYKEMWTFGLHKHQASHLSSLILGPPSAQIEVPDLRFDYLLSTRAAVALLTGTSDVRLLKRSEVAELLGAHIGPDAVSEEFQAALQSAAKPPRIATAAPVELGLRWAAEVQQQVIAEFGRMGPSALRSPHFVSGLLLMDASALDENTTD